MKLKLIGTLAMVVAVMAVSQLFAEDARADNGPHVAGNGMTTDACAGCHRAHTASAALLLKAAEETLCASCHDGTGASTQVWAGKQTTSGLALKAGGFTKAYIDTKDQTWSRHIATCPAGTDPHEYGTGSGNTPIVGASCLTYAAAAAYLHISANTGLSDTLATVSSRHDTDGVSKPVPGGTSSVSLKCTTCHDPHGNGQYRILRPDPATEGGGSDRKTAVLVGEDSTHTYTTTNYMSSGVGPASDDTATTGITAWCSQCHSKYIANLGSAESADGEGKYKHATVNYAPGCVKCHAAHGTNAQFSEIATGVAGSGPGGLNYASEAGGGSTRLLKMDNRGICLKCHKR